MKNFLILISFLLFTSCSESSNEISKKYEDLALKKALENLAKSPEIYYNIANVLKKLKKPIETISYYEKAIALKPNFSPWA